MKLYFETKNLGEDCITPCPFEDPDCMVGSVECQNCKHCYGANIKKLECHASIDENNAVTFNANHYIFCDAVYKKPPFKTKLRKFFYKLAYWFKNDDIY